MKLLTSTERSKKHSFICLESKEDADTYSKINDKIKSRQAVSFWMGFKSQNFRATPLDYLVHEVSDNNSIASVLAAKMQCKEEPTSLVQYCNYSDNIINDMNNCIYRYINRGDKVRLNVAGGYCPIRDIEGYESAEDINEQQMLNFLLHRDINFDFKIEGDSVLIENDSYIPKELVRLFSEKNNKRIEDVQILASFKHRTLLFKDHDFIKLFTDGVEQGLQNVVFKTIAQDVPQINKLKSVLEAVMGKYPNKILHIWCSIPQYSQKLINTKTDNIRIHFL